MWKDVDYWCYVSGVFLYFFILLLRLLLINMELFYFCIIIKLIYRVSQTNMGIQWRIRYRLCYELAIILLCLLEFILWKDCKDVSIVSPQDEKWRQTSLLCLYNVNMAELFKKKISNSSLNSHVYWNYLY